MVPGPPEKVDNVDGEDESESDKAMLEMSE